MLSLLQRAFLTDSVILSVIDPHISAKFGAALCGDWLPGSTIGECLYRGSVDGMNARAFHERCDGRDPTLTLIRVDGGAKYVFGGYTSTPWSSAGHYARCEDAFLFCVVGPGRTIAKFPVSPAKRDQAMFCSPLCGPSFGSDVQVMSANMRTMNTDPFDAASNCFGFGTLEGAYMNYVGSGPTDTGLTATVGRYANFTPVDIEVFFVVRSPA